MLDSEIIEVIIPELKIASVQNKTPAFVFDRVSNLDEDSHSLEFQGARSRRYGDLTHANLLTSGGFWLDGCPPH